MREGAKGFGQIKPGRRSDSSSSALPPRWPTPEARYVFRSHGHQAGSPSVPNKANPGGWQPW
jgi:hypothetical protein